MSDSKKFDVANSQFVGLKAFVPQFLVLFFFCFGVWFPRFHAR
jgi:hypothetical protein